MCYTRIIRLIEISRLWDFSVLEHHLYHTWALTYDSTVTEKLSFYYYERKKVGTLCNKQHQILQIHIQFWKYEVFNDYRRTLVWSNVKGQWPLTSQPPLVELLSFTDACTMMLYTSIWNKMVDNFCDICEFISKFS